MTLPAEQIKSKARAFGKVPFALIASGICAALIRNELAALLVILGHANASGFVASPSMETIAELGGMSISTARRAVRSRERKGIVDTHRSAGHRPNVYRIIVEPEPRPGHYADRVTASQPGHRDDRVTRPESTSYPVKTDLIPGHLDDRRTEEQNEQRRSAADAASSSGSQSEAEKIAANAEALTAYGIRNPARDRIAAHPAITPAIIEGEAERAGGCNGVLVNRLKDVVSTHDAEQRKAELRVRLQAQREAKRERERADVARRCDIERRASERVRATVTDEVAAARWQAAVDITPSLLREYMVRNGPDKCPMLFAKAIDADLYTATYAEIDAATPALRGE